MAKRKKNEEKPEGSEQKPEKEEGVSFAEDLVQILASQESQESSIRNVIEEGFEQSPQEPERTISYEQVSEEPLKADYGSEQGSYESQAYSYAKAFESSMFYSSQDSSEGNDYREKAEKEEEERERIRRVL